MEPRPSHGAYRYKRRNPNPRSQLYFVAQGMSKAALEHYHYLCASIQGKFVLSNYIPMDMGDGQIFHQHGLDFSPYTEYELRPIVSKKALQRPIGTYHPDELKLYHEYFANDWMHSAGGILHNMKDRREFFNCILNYHSPAKTTGNEEWDAFFEKFKESGFQKSLVPCMHFGNPMGCLVDDCPFLHDEEMLRERRDRILAARKKALFEPTPKQRLEYAQKYESMNRGRNTSTSPSAAMNGLSLEGSGAPRVRHFCAKEECAKPWLAKDKGDHVLQKCARCQWTYYCSITCQKADWPRHKSECAPAEEVIANDNLWTSIGTRKGTDGVDTEWRRAVFGI
ncbi:hypothetical protein SCHPADRAFT_974350 [Schizopora paradoxa]|uniref:MYND-type domain-containing protein n=1 Tax=Schizopora paradoxa TaxID=27342 RepID=A0A0H2S3Y0_9AGAM|nr:hypothetical protein SCHPADRAFT_974350 [Schizopora paradoxa]